MRKTCENFELWLKVIDKLFLIHFPICFSWCFLSNRSWNARLFECLQTNEDILRNWIISNWIKSEYFKWMLFRTWLISLTCFCLALKWKILPNQLLKLQSFLCKLTIRALCMGRANTENIPQTTDSVLFWERILAIVVTSGDICSPNMNSIYCQHLNYISSTLWNFRAHNMHWHCYVTAYWSLFPTSLFPYLMLFSLWIHFSFSDFVGWLNLDKLLPI